MSSFVLAGVVGASAAVIASQGLHLDTVVSGAVGVAVAASALAVLQAITPQASVKSESKSQEKKESKKAKAKSSKSQQETSAPVQPPKQVEEVAPVATESKKKKKTQESVKAVEPVQQKQQTSAPVQTQQQSKSQKSDAKQSTQAQQPAKTDSKQQPKTDVKQQQPAKTETKQQPTKTDAKQPQQQQQQPAKTETKAAEKPKEKKEKSQVEKDADDGWEVAKPTKSVQRQQEKEKAAAAAKVAASSTPKTVVAAPVTVVAEEKETELEMAVGLTKLGVIIGEKGATLKALQDATQTKIEVPKKDSGSSKLIITGPVANVQACKAAIDSLLTRGFSSATHPGFVHDEVNVDPKFYGTIIGPSGATLKALQKSTGARINMPDRRDDRNHKVTIVGYKEQVHAARAALKQLVSEGVSEFTHEHFLKMDFPADKKSILIGPKGQTIKSIQGNTRTKINLPDHGDYIIIVGSPEDTKKAEREITNLIAPDEDIVVAEDEDDDVAHVYSSTNSWSASATANGEDDLW